MDVKVDESGNQPGARGVDDAHAFGDGNAGRRVAPNARDDSPFDEDVRLHIQLS
jgi:hypothetical protein